MTINGTPDQPPPAAAKDTPHPAPTGKLKKFAREWLWPLFVVAMIVAPFRSAVADWNDVPTGSMEPTILPGDRLPPADAGGLVVYATNVAGDFEPATHRDTTRRCEKIAKFRRKGLLKTNISPPTERKLFFDEFFRELFQNYQELREFRPRDVLNQTLKALVVL